MVAAHPPSAREPIDNEKILFITRDNEIIERTIIGRSSSWNLVYDETMDFTIFLLDEDLPKEIEILKTYPSELIEEIPNSKLTYKVGYTEGTTVTYTNEYSYRIQDPSFAFATNQDETTSILKLTGLTFDYNKPTGDLFSQVRWAPGSNRTGGGEKVDIQWFTSFRADDSSSPIMSVLNNQLVLASVATRTINGSFTGGTLGNKILNDLITEVDKAAGVLTGYNVTPFDPNKPPFRELPGPNKPPIKVDPEGTGTDPEGTDTGSGTGTRTHGKTYTLQIFNQSSNRQNINTTPGIGSGTQLEKDEPGDLIEMTSNVNAFEFQLITFGDFNIDLLPFRANITNRELLSEQATTLTIAAQVAGEDENGEEFTIGTIYIRDRIPTNPDPTDPDPTDPDPTDPDPTGPDTTDPDPTDPDPTGPDTTITSDPDPTGFGPGPTGTPVTIPPPFTNIIPPGGGLPPPFITDTPTEIPPPDIPIIPFTPADCGTPPVVRLGLPPQEDPEFVPPEILEEPVIEEVFLYPAPVDSFTAPFLSNIDFNTNFTKKEPTPFNFDEEVELTVDEAIVSAPNVKINLCEEEECSELGF